MKKMASLRSGKLYPRLLACFMGIVFFASAIAAAAAGCFSKKSEEAFFTRVVDNMETISNRLSNDVLTLFDLCRLISSNALIQENFRPYDVLSTGQQYYYNAIMDMLSQSRLQYNGLVDSVFLYSDDERVLYAAGEKGMSGSRAFFSRIMAFQSSSYEDWMRLLEGRRLSCQVLPPDAYQTKQMNDGRPVIPVAYLTINHGYPNVLVMNLSLEKIRALYEGNAVFRQTRFGVYTLKGEYLLGERLAFEADPLDIPRQISVSGEPHYLVASRQPALGIAILSLTPRAAMAEMTGYYQFLIIALPSLVAVFGIFLALFLSRKMYEPFRMVHASMPPSAGFGAEKQSELEAVKTGIAALASERQIFFNQSRERLAHYVSQTLSALLSGRQMDDEPYFTQLMLEEYGFASSRCRVVDLLLDLDSPASYLTIHDAMKHFSQIIQETFKPCGPFIRVRFRENMYALVFNVGDGRQETLAPLCREAARQVSLRLGLHASLRCGIGCVVGQFSELPESFDAANSAVFAIQSSEGFDAAPQDGDFRYDRREVLSALSACDVKLVEAACEEILSAAKRASVPYPRAAAVLKDIFQTAASFRHGLIPQSALPLEAVDPITVLLLSPRINTTPLIAALLPYIPRPGQTKGEDGAEKIAQRMKAFIDGNYQRELSLDILSEELGLSAKYLSRVFKQTMEVNLSDYLAYVRVEKIKELLLTGLSLDRIAEQAGINNRTTFTRTFRKLEGVSPSEWRRVHQEQLADYLRAEDGPATDKKPE